MSEVRELLEEAIFHYDNVNTLFNRIFRRNVIAEFKKDLFKKYQIACLELDVKYDDDLKELIEDIEQEIL